jgi:hypothetical protein
VPEEMQQRAGGEAPGRLTRPQRPCLGRAARKHANPYLYENLFHNLEGQSERWRARAIQAGSFEEQRHWASKAEGVEYAMRLLNAFRSDFGLPDNEDPGGAYEPAARKV